MSNQVREGYKQTEIGVIPEDWDVRAVGDVCDCIVPGRNKPKIFKGDIPWITTPDLEDGRSVSESKLGLFVSRNEAKSVGSKIVPIGAVLMSCVGELGIVAFVKREIVINQQLHAFIPTSVVEPFFLLNALQAQKEYMLSIATLTAVPYLNKNNCNSIPIPLPPLSEQRSLAQALSDVDALISALDKLIAKKRDLKTATMQQLLTGKKRLPGSGEGQGYKESAIGLIPEDWEVRLMSSLATIQRGASPRPIDSLIWYDSQSTVGWVRISDITSSDGKSLRSTRDYLSTKGIAQSRFLPTGSLIMSICATVGIPVITQIESCIHDGFVGFSNLQDIEREFFYYKLKELEAYFRSKGQTGSQSNLNSDIVRYCEVALPSLEEQRAIALVLSDMDNAIASLESRQAKTQAIKQGMMQELLTGRTRLV